MKLSVNQIIIFGFLFHLLAAVYSIGHHHCDELFQIYEFAGYKLQINQLNDLPWEFAAKMRSGIQPLIVFGISKLFFSIGINNPFHIAILIRVLQSIFSFFVLVKFLKLFEPKFESESFKKLLWFCGLLLWCMPYFHARFSSENFSVSVFVLSVIIIYKQHEQIKFTRYLLAGVLFGLAFCIRFQTLFFIIGLAAWLLWIQRISYKQITLLLFGLSLALVFGYYCDYWLYDTFTFSWWNYLNENLFQNKANNFGTAPFYFYITESILQLIPPFSLIILAAFIYFFFKHSKSLITWMCLPFIILHLLVGHKELRFLFPLLYFMPFILCSFIEYLYISKNKFGKLVSSRGFVKFTFILNAILLLFFTFKPADDEALIFKKIYDYAQGDQAVLYFEKRNPYNNQAGLNYFRKRGLQLMNITESTLTRQKSTDYYFGDGFTKQDIIIKQSKVFIRVYSNFPDWIDSFNFNGWLQRANAFSIYKRYQ